MAATDYSARHLTVLEGLEAVRKRPGMYIGSTDSRGLMHCLWELIDNSVDESVAGHGTEITVEIFGDGSVQVSDLGRGVPVDIEPRTGLTGVELVFTKLHAGGKFGAGSYAASGGLHGVGASVVNALCFQLDSKSREITTLDFFPSVSMSPSSKSRSPLSSQRVSTKKRQRNAFILFSE